MARKHARTVTIPDAVILDAVRALGRVMNPITGDLAYQFARVLHAAGLDGPGQWGNAYFCCPGCGGGHDCDGTETEEYTLGGVLAYAECSECETALTLADLRLSEGWVERL